MKAMNDLFDDELRRRLKAYTEEPDPRLWQSVLSQVSTGRTLRRKKPWVLWIAMGLIVTSGLYLFLNTEVGTGASVQATDSQEIPRPLPTDVDKEKETTGQMQNKANPAGTGTGLSGRREGSVKRNHIQNIPSASDRTLVVRDDDRVEIGDMSAIAPSTVSDIAVGISADNAIPTALENIPGRVRNNTNARPDTTQRNASRRDKKRHPFNVYFTIMPTMAYNRVEPNPHDNFIVESIDRLAAFSSERLGVRAELGAEYPVARRVNVFGGLVYFQRHQTIGYTEKQVSNTETKPGPNGEIIIEPDFSYVHKSFEHEVRNLGIQLGVNYQLRKKKFLHTAGTGIEFHTALNKSRPQAAEGTTNPSAYVFYNLYYRIQYPTETKLRAVVQPTFNYAFYINENLNAPFYIKPYGLGLNVGFTYNFLKP